MAILTYDGSAKDHEIIPEVLRKGVDGKPMKRKVVKPARLVEKQVGTYNLRGMLFPAGQPQGTLDKDTIKKAVALGCFDVAIVKGEPITYGNAEWLTTALQGGRVKLVEKAPEAPAASQAETPKHEDVVDEYDQMKLPELKRLASSRGLNLAPSMKKADVIALLREQEAPARAEASLEGGDEFGDDGADFNLDEAVDVG